MAAIQGINSLDCSANPEYIDGSCKPVNNDYRFMPILRNPSRHLTGPAAEKVSGKALTAQETRRARADAFRQTALLMRTAWRALKEVLRGEQRSARRHSLALTEEGVSDDFLIAPKLQMTTTPQLVRRSALVPPVVCLCT